MRALRYDGQLVLDGAHLDPTPGDDECLIRIRIAGVSEADLRIAAGQLEFRGILGHEMVGVVERGPSKWRGRRVVCDINCVCRACDMCLSGLSNHCRRRTVLGLMGRDGCFAELIAVPVRNVHAVPDSLSDEEAVFAGPLAAAYQVLAQCPTDRRMKVSVIGPDRLGLLVAQVLRTTGCSLTVIGHDSDGLELCEKKGIQGIRVEALAPASDRDVVVECTGGHEGLRLALSLVRPRGTIVLKGWSASRAIDRGNTMRRSAVTTEVVDPRIVKPAAEAPVDLTPLVANEVTLVGSRCGPLPVAIDALARGAVDVRSMAIRVFDFDEAIAALKFAASSGVVTTLLRLST